MTATPVLAAPLVPAYAKGWMLLGIYVLVTAAASITGSFASNPDTSAWYQALNQPPFSAAILGVWCRLAHSLPVDGLCRVARRYRYATGT